MLGNDVGGSGPLAVTAVTQGVNGAVTTDTNRKRFYVIVTGDSSDRTR